MVKFAKIWLAFIGFAVLLGIILVVIVGLVKEPIIGGIILAIYITLFSVLVLANENENDEDDE